MSDAGGPFLLKSFGVLARHIIFIDCVSLGYEFILDKFRDMSTIG